MKRTTTKFFALFAGLLIVGACSSSELKSPDSPAINNPAGSEDDDNGDSGDNGTSGGDAGSEGKALSPWSEGYLDIHTINTGRGDCTFFILPDGTQMLVDMASATSSSHTFVPAKPDAMHTAAYYIRRYIQECMQWTGNDIIDYVVLTHWHTDHIGTYSSSNPRGTGGDYTRGGVTEILDNLSVGKVIDRGYYEFPSHDNYWTSIKGAIDNYIKCFQYHADNNGLTREKFEPGRNDQITLQRNAASYGDFLVQNISANGYVWTREGTTTRYMFIPESEFDTATDGDATEKCPGENSLSIAFRLSYGDFDYYTGGDASNNGSGTFSWKITETSIAEAVGQVEAMKANHHGSFDANGEPLLKTLDPQVLIIQTWNTAQPHLNTMNRLPGSIPDADVFITNLDASQKSTFPEAATGMFRSESGHYVIRVAPGGVQYYVYVLEDDDESMTVVDSYGPYKCR